jgi:alkanesulfonate monooxygenase SsuD/methylene tetrahydromethanopterin reductase-like flavin-dependent oxidoreductase (luciferase family)
VFLLPLHDATRVAAAGLELERLAPGRFELGVGLGYREAELDGLGVSRRRRARIVDDALETLTAAWAEGGPRLWIGGIAERSLARAAEHALSIFLPSTMAHDQLRDTIARVREHAAKSGTQLARIGVLKNAWVTSEDRGEERRMRELIAAQQREYAGSWWLLRGELGFDVPQLLDEQMLRTADTALVGSAAAVAEGVSELADLGVDLVVLHLSSDLTRPAYRENMHRIATDVLPSLR